MATSRPFAYNPSLTPIAGSTQVGTLAVGGGSGGGVTWWDGPDEELGYVIAVPVSGNTQPTPMPGVYASVGFYRSDLTESSFISWAQYVSAVYGNPQTFTTGSEASVWLYNNGYWTNYANYPPLSNPDAANYVAQIVAAGGGGTLNATITSALDVLFNDLQNTSTYAGPSFYSVLEGFYPMLGLTSATQAINGNGNATYDLQFAGGWTFDSMGMKGNGINTYASINKFYYAGTTDLYNTHFSIYGTLANNSPSNRGDLTLLFADDDYMGARIALNTLTNGDGLYEYTFNSSATFASSNSADFVVISNDSATTYRYRNGLALSSGGDVPYSIYDHVISLGLSKYSGVYQPSTNKYGWASFGGFMSEIDMGNYQTIVNTFMTSIGRNTY